jgi:hypothetical protein
MLKNPLGRRGGGPLLLGGALYALLLAGWMSISDRLPPALKDLQWRVGRFVDVEDADTPLYSYGRVRPGGLLLAGDSRITAACSLEVLTEAGIDDAWLVMGPSGQLKDVLAAARAWPTKRMVLALSPLSIYGPPQVGPRIVLAEERGGWTTHKIDDALSEWLNSHRKRWLRRIHPGMWDDAWFGSRQPAGSVPFYRGLMRGQENRRARRARLAELETGLAALRDEGWRIVCVRLPVSEPVREVEAAGMQPDLIAAAVARLGLPFLDYYEADFETGDGSHLYPAEGRRMSARLARDLAAIPGFLE